MSALLPNLAQIGVALLLLCLLALPVGWGLLRLCRLAADAPTAIILGLIVLPLGLNLLATSPALFLLLLFSLGLLAWQFRPTGRGLPDRAARYQHEAPFSTPPRHRLALLIIALVAGGITLFPLLLYDLEIDGRWYHIMAGDWVKHIGVGNALVTGEPLALPPPNPFLSAEPHLRYYYLGYVLPALTHPLSGGMVRVSSGLVAQALLLASLFPWLSYRVARRVGIGAAGALVATGLLVLVSGMDILYVLAERWQQGLWVEHIDFWADHDLRRINSLSNMFIWTPQHALGVAAFLLLLEGLHTLWQRQNLRAQGAVALFIALIIAALSGISAFVWFGVLAGLGLFALVEGLRWWRSREGVYGLSPLLMLGGALGFALLLSLPYLQLVSARDEAALQVAVSPVVPGLQYGALFTALFGEGTLSSILDFPLQMALEFGAVALLGAWGWWRLWQQEGRTLRFRLWTLLLLLFFLVVLALRPDRADSNNYAARVAPLAWVLLAFLGGYAWGQLPAMRYKGLFQTALLLLLLPGLASTFYEPWIQQGPNYQRLLGLKPFAERYNFVDAADHDLYQWLDEHLPPAAIYQVGWESGKATHFVQRRSALAEGYLALLYLSDDALFHIKTLASLDLGYRAEEAAEARRGFRNIGIDVLAVPIDQPFAAQQHPDFAEYFILVYENSRYKVYEVQP